MHHFSLPRRCDARDAHRLFRILELRLAVPSLLNILLIISLSQLLLPKGTLHPPPGCF